MGAGKGESGKAGEEPAGRDPSEERLAGLFVEFLEALDQGRDIAAELLERAGDLRAPLEAKLGLERELRALSRDLGMGSKTPGATQLVGRFHVLGSLGSGGISRVLLAHDPELNRQIALKILDREVLLDKGQRAWILNEARSLARIEHPGVVKVFEIGETETHAYVAMELLSGPSLREVIDEWARQRAGGATEEPRAEVRELAARLAPFSARCACLARLAEALAHCHDHGILQRDVKPQNVLFDAAGEPKLIDFGLAHVVGADVDSSLGVTQALVGTAAYIAPEQVENERTGADPRSDQFSFGTLAFECFALENPFLRKSRSGTIDAIATADPPSLRKRVPALPPDLARVIHHALARLPEERYPSMAALAADLRAVLANRPISVSEPALTHLVKLWVRRHRRGVAVALGALGLMLGALAVTWIVDAARQRGRLSARLAGVQPGQLGSQADFMDTFSPLFELKQAARDFEAGFWRRILFGGIADSVTEVIHAWSRGLGDLLGKETSESERLGMGPPHGLYPTLFTLDALLCPECPDNAEPRARGTVSLPEEDMRGRESALDLYSLVEFRAGNVVYAFRPARKVKCLVAGTYRLQIWDPGAGEVRSEVVFFVPEGWPPWRKVEIQPPRTELLSRTKAFARSQVALLGGCGTIEVAAFRMLDHLTSEAEFARFVAETGHATGHAAESHERASASDRPAWVDYESAMAYAAWAGGRLPTKFELEAAELAGWKVSAASLEHAGGEYLLDMGPRNRFVPTWRDYSKPQPYISEGARSGLVQSLGPNGLPAGFRLVFCGDDPDTYRRLAEHPLRSAK